MDTNTPFSRHVQSSGVVPGGLRPSSTPRSTYARATSLHTKDSFIYRVFQKTQNGEFGFFRFEVNTTSANTPSADEASLKSARDPAQHGSASATPGLSSDDKGSDGVDVSLHSIKSDVNEFFQDMPSTFHSHEVFRGKRRYANDLLERALKQGSLDDIRSLYLWKIMHGTFSDVDAAHVCSRCTTLAQRTNQSELLDFYVNLFASPCFRQLEQKRRLKHGLEVLANALDWDLQSGSISAIEDLRHLLLRSVDTEELVSALSIKCKDLLEQNRVSQAVDLLLIAAETWNDSKQFISLADEIFTSALSKGMLSPCAQLLRWRRSFAPVASLRELCSYFIQACSEQKAYRLLLEFFSSFSEPNKDLSGFAFRLKLDARARATLAIACSTDGAQTSAFQVLYRSLSSEDRTPVDSIAIPSMLTNTWHSTRNLDAVRSQYATTKALITRIGAPKLLRKLNFIMLEILVSANCVDEALATLVRLNKLQGADSKCIVQAASLFAKQHAWEALARLLDLAKGMTSLRFSTSMNSTFNQVVRAYSQHHNAQETWNFVTSAVDALAFQPTRATTEIMLTCFASVKAIDLIPGWLRYLQVLGHRFRFDATAAAQMLARYYVEFRPNHILLMWFCRRLTRHAPSMISEELVDLVKQAIGYDLRKMSGQHAHWLADHARSRLKSFEEDGQRMLLMPSPGYRYNRELHFDHKLASGQYLDSPEERDRIAASEGSVSVTAYAGRRSALHATDTGATSEIRDFGSTQAPPDGNLVRESSEEQSHALVVAWNKEDFDSTEGLSTRKSEQPPASNQREDEYEMPFSHLRPIYGEDFAAMEHNIALHGAPKRRMLEWKMLTALSFDRCEEVVSLYHDSLDAVGLPASAKVLEAAVEASLRLNSGRSSDAERIMSKARAAGMNVTCALGPLLIRRIRRLDPRSRRDADSLRTMTIEYYRMNDENGWAVQHHVGITAANSLIVHDRPKYGLNIMSAIYQSEWVHARPLDIVSMTVFLKGYIAVGSLAGIKWVVQTVLQKEMRVDLDFTNLLKQATRAHVYLAKGVRRTNDIFTRRARASLCSWLELCRERRATQRKEAKEIGWKLVKCLIRCAREEPTIDLDQRQMAERELFGKLQLEQSEEAPSESLDDPKADSSALSEAQRQETRVDSLRARRLRLRKLKQDPELHSSYQRFLRKPMVTSDGRLASFRYHAPRRVRRRASVARMGRVSQRSILDDEDDVV